MFMVASKFITLTFKDPDGKLNLFMLLSPKQVMKNTGSIYPEFFLRYSASCVQMIKGIELCALSFINHVLKKT